RTYRVAPGVYRVVLYSAPQEPGEDVVQMAAPMALAGPIAPTQDANVYSYDRDRNDGNLTIMGLETDRSPGEGTLHVYGFTQFDLSSIPAPRYVAAARLFLWCDNIDHMNASSRRCNVHRAAAPWSENTITWRNQPGVTGEAVQRTSFPEQAW